MRTILVCYEKDTFAFYISSLQFFKRLIGFNHLHDREHHAVIKCNNASHSDKKVVKLAPRDVFPRQAENKEEGYQEIEEA